MALYRGLGGAGTDALLTDVTEQANIAVQAKDTAVEAKNAAISARNDVQSAAQDAAIIVTLEDDISALSDLQTEISGLYSIRSDISAVEDIATNVTTVAGISADVTTVASDTANINTIVTDLNGADTIGTVATNISNVNTVAGIDSDVTTVATNNANITTVATDIADVNSLATNIANVTTVAGNATNITTVAGLESDIQSVITNISAIQSAPQNAVDAETALSSFQAVYLGDSSTQPTIDGNGDPVSVGDLYFDTTANEMRVYDGTSWAAAGSAVNGTAERVTYTATASQTTFNVTYDVGFVDVYLNGVKLVLDTDFTASSGTNIVLSTGASAGDIVDIVAYGAFELANVYTQTAADARFAQLSNNLSDLASASAARTNLGLGTMAVETATDYLTTTSASSTYAPLTDPTFTGTVTATSFSGDGSALTGLAGETFDFELAENITAGNVVRLLGAGTIEAVTGTATTTSFDVVNDSTQFNVDGAGFGSFGSHVKVFFSSTANKVIIVYQDSQNSSYITVRVGTISGSTVTFGSEYVLVSVDTGYYACDYDDSNEKLIFIYRAANSYCYVRAASISGTVVTGGSVLEVRPQNTVSVNIRFDPQTPDSFIYTREENATDGLYINAGTLSGTTINVGTEFRRTTTNSSSASGIIFDPNTAGKAVIVTSGGAGQSYYQYGTVVTISSGVTFTAGTFTQILTDRTNSKSTEEGPYRIIAHPDGSSRFVVSYLKFSSGGPENVYAYILTLSGSSVTASTPVQLTTTTDYYNVRSLAFIANTDNYMYVMARRFPTISPQNIHDFIRFEVSDTTISSPTLVYSNEQTSGNQGYFEFNPQSPGQIGYVFVSEDFSSDAVLNFSTLDIVDTNLDDASLIGVLQESGSTGEVKPVALRGRLDSSQTGLTPGATYYALADGSISTTSDATAVNLGRALSATKLLLRGL